MLEVESTFAPHMSSSLSSPLSSRRRRERRQRQHPLGRQVPRALLIAVILVEVFAAVQTAAVSTFVTSPVAFRRYRSQSYSRPLLSESLRRRHAAATTTSRSNAAASGTDDDNDDPVVDLEYLKTELTEYLEKRKMDGGDEKAKENVGKVIGGSRGNPVLDWVSAAPNKPQQIDSPPNPLDYDELNKYGYGYLVTPIMKAGGRPAMYRLLGLDEPVVTKPKKVLSAPEMVVIDKTGTNDRARYSGLKLGQVLDDNMQGKALVEAQEKAKQGEPLRPKLQEEQYVRPFAEKRNVGPKQTPYWTAEKLDEWGKQRGRAQAWARRARTGEFLSDPDESVLELPAPFRLYSVLTALVSCAAFGKSTMPFVAMITPLVVGATTSITTDGQMLEQTTGETVSSVLTALQAPASALILSCVGSAAYCAFVASSQDKNRNPVVWSVKGLIGGPLAMRLLRDLPPLARQGENEKERKP